MLFLNTNGPDIVSDDHSLRKLCNKNKSQNFNILSLSETNAHLKNKKANDAFRNTISKEWKGKLVTTSETKLI